MFALSGAHVIPAGVTEPPVEAWTVRALARTKVTETTPGPSTSNGAAPPETLTRLPFSTNGSIAIEVGTYADPFWKTTGGTVRFWRPPGTDALPELPFAPNPAAPKSADHAVSFGNPVSSNVKGKVAEATDCNT